MDQTTKEAIERIVDTIQETINLLNPILNTDNFEDALVLANLNDSHRDLINLTKGVMPNEY